MVYGILLVYYESYSVRAINEFKKLLNGLDLDCKIIVIYNNYELIKKLKNINNITLIQGDNSNWEFSGWDKGLEYIKNIGFNDNDSFIFANDTFCHHNYWGKYEKFIFRKTFKKIIKKNIFKPSVSIVGNVDSFNQDFTINGFHSNSWVSTYLFLVTAKYLKCAKENVISKKMVKYYPNTNEIIWDDSVSENLKKHIMNWMFPNESKGTGWYKKDSVDLELKVKKIQAILNEKYLSALCKSNDGKIVDVKDIYFLRTLKKIIF